MTTHIRRPPATHQPGIPRKHTAGDDADLQHLDFEIRKQAQAAVLVSLLSPLITPWVAGPVAIYMGRQTLGRIKKSGAGEKHARLARIGVWIGVVVTVVSYFVGIPALVLYAQFSS